MKQLFLLVFSSLISGSALLAQTTATSSTSATTTTEGSTSFYAELGGPGILFSANLDTRFKKGTRLGWGGRAGLGFVTYTEDIYVPDPYGGYYTSGDQRSVVTVPVQVNYVFGKPNSPHTFEVGGGLTVAGKKIDIFNYRDSDETSVFGTASFMYRRQPAGGGFSWRIGFTPLIANGFIQPSGAVSVGYNF